MIIPTIDLLIFLAPWLPPKTRTNGFSTSYPFSFFLSSISFSVKFNLTTFVGLPVNTTSNGVNALSLLEAGKRLGFYTEGVKGDILKLEDRFLPCIAHVIIDKKYKHFVVIHNIDRKNNYITLVHHCGNNL